MKLNKEEKKMLIELICNEQTHMIVKDHTKYDSQKYKKLEKLKVKIKDLWNACFMWWVILKESWWNVKLKILLKIFDVLHRDLKDIYYILISMNFIGEKREDRIKQGDSDFDWRFTYAKADIEEEIAKQKEETDWQKLLREIV